MLESRGIESQIDGLRKIETVFGGFGCYLWRDVSVRTVMLVQSKIFGHRSEDSRVKVDVIAEEDVVTSEGPVGLDLVMSGEIKKIERFVWSVRG